MSLQGDTFEQITLATLRTFLTTNWGWTNAGSRGWDGTGCLHRDLQTAVNGHAHAKTMHWLNFEAAGAVAHRTFPLGDSALSQQATTNFTC